MLPKTSITGQAEIELTWEDVVDLLESMIDDMPPAPANKTGLNRLQKIVKKLDDVDLLYSRQNYKGPGTITRKPYQGPEFQ